MNAMRLIRNRRVALATVAAVCVAFAAATAVAMTGGGVYIPQLGRSVPSEKAAAIEHSLPRTAPESKGRAPEPAAPESGISARILGPEVPVPVSPLVLRPNNGWEVSDGLSLVSVYAGQAGDDDSVGRVVILRQNARAGAQTQDIVDAGAVGALRVVRAPLGVSVETSAQRGDLVLGDVHGRAHVLHLANDTITTQ